LQGRSGHAGPYSGGHWMKRQKEDELRLGPILR
jgi:hypothetical protein